MLGKYLAENQIRVIYGGAQVGIMGAVANGVLEIGGEVIGILPTFLRIKEIAHEGLTEVIATETMHERKTKMVEYADAFLILPGGFGTLDEMFEILTWGQLGLHSKPVGILNIAGYYDGLLIFIDSMVDKGILKQINRDMILVHDQFETLLDKMHQYQGEIEEKWV
jgi:uncharacterized protein (TIGR00730 family)